MVSALKCSLAVAIMISLACSGVYFRLTQKSNLFELIAICLLSTCSLCHQVLPMRVAYHTEMWAEIRGG